MEKFGESGATLICFPRSAPDQNPLEFVNWSGAILVAEYGDWAFSGCASVIGTNWAVPYTSLVEV